MRSLGHTDHFVAGSVGRPGRRRFLIEIGAGDRVEWFLLEKQQVAALAAQCLQLLDDMGIPRQDPGPDLGAPGEPTFRVGQIALGQEEDGIVVVLSPTEGDAEPVAATVSAERLGAMARRALQVVAAGRPACRFCGNPKDADGHTCPASNGDLRHR